MPPDVESTSGVKTPCSISSMRWPYVLFFSSSCFLYAAGRLLELLLGALGWNRVPSPYYRTRYAARYGRAVRARIIMRMRNTKSA